MGIEEGAWAKTCPEDVTWDKVPPEDAVVVWAIALEGVKAVKEDGAPPLSHPNGNACGSIIREALLAPYASAYGGTDSLYWCGGACSVC